MENNKARTIAFSMVAQLGYMKAANVEGNFFHNEHWLDPHYCICHKIQKMGEAFDAPWKFTTEICVDIEDGRVIDKLEIKDVGNNSNIYWKRCEEAIRDLVKPYVQF